MVGAIFDKAYIIAIPNNLLQGLQSISIGPGDGASVEFTSRGPEATWLSITPFAMPRKGRCNLRGEVATNPVHNREKGEAIMSVRQVAGSVGTNLRPTTASSTNSIND